MHLRRALAGAVIGAALSALSPVVLSWMRPAIEIDLDARSVVTGAYPREHVQGERFSWTTGELVVTLTELDRRVPWTCDIDLRGGRSDPSTLPDVIASVDGSPGATFRATNEYQRFEFTIPSAQRRGAHLRLNISNTFQPGPTDLRRLGVQIARWTCATTDDAGAVPSWSVTLNAGAAGAIFGAGFGLLGAPPLATVIGSGLIGAAQSVLLAHTVGSFAPFAARLPAAAFWLTGFMVVPVVACQRLLRRGLSPATRFVVAFSTGSLYVKLLALMHPSMPVGDSVFHAHRFEWVLDGRYLFAQPLEGSVAFPYAIALYVVAAPFARLTKDHASLLRGVVLVCEAAAPMLLYAAVAARWRDRFAGAVALVLFTLVPVSYWVIHDSNLTNAFGRSVALAAVMTAALGSDQRNAVWRGAALAGLAATAMLSHVSLFALVATTLMAIALVFWWQGDRDTARAAPVVMLGVVAGLALAVGLYYIHFTDAYLQVLNSLGTPAPALSAAASPVAAATSDVGVTSAGFVQITATRVADAAALTVQAVGWPILALALVGVWRAWVDGLDRVLLVAVGLAIAYAVFVAVAVLTPVDPENQRFAGQFVGRVVYATCPAAVLVASRGFTWSWRHGGVARVAAAAVGVAAFSVGARAWFGLLF